MREGNQETERLNNDQKNISGLSKGLSSFGEFLWNSNTNEFLGRDGESWGKVFEFQIDISFRYFYPAVFLTIIGKLSLFYAVFYLIKLILEVLMFIKDLK